MTILSPITGKPNTALERTISSSDLITAYKKELGIDTARFFEGLSSVSIHTCLDTGYRFYHPFTISGDDFFYQQLEKFPWYYMSWKWEHSIAENYIKKGDKVLEIGCARGDFIERIKEKGAHVDGLEMNTEALKECLKKGLTAYEDHLAEYSIKKAGYYDMVCSFEVLEHIADVKNFIENSIKLLKPGGKMLVGVPNNDSFILKSDIILNMPPHHMGLWNMNSLIKIQNHFLLTLQDVHIEPLQPYHIAYARKFAKKKLDEKFTNKIPDFMKKMLNTIGNRFINFATHAHSENMVGQTIIAVYKKNE